ncbi:hydroxyneurosporene synthase (CrtC) [Exophiala aquamarina CBS 119918]|uniref:Hydroxyneurosporene synthase (CrtC) n=1 Tax=Exophiala aquamarina CBS 119918 TaxID=1182545 RepID=A0A072NYL6_9EURO|nr:hydroxyneurosporene synthase (CrtC) [Exophiala aquamarina CBS 119918]KEF52118.1 hydroxyneurosporene synthase (CrtC) [Exophiala aquamarina CBS 119918]
MVLSHLVELSETQTIYRSSIQDVTNTSYHRHFIELVEDPDVFSGSQDGAFNVSADGFYFGSTTSDNSISQLRTVSTSPDVSFDLTFDLSASILFNGGLGGLFQWGGSQTAEWAMTSGYTSGSIIRDGQSIEFDPERSFTWYDRQWLYGDASALNWTWFQLHTDSSRDGPGEKYSIWIYGGDVDQHQFATFHSSKRVDTVLAVKSFEPFGEPWQSSVTNNTYEQHWKLILQDDTMLTIDSIHGDQEIFSGTAGAYEGFVEFHGFDSLNRTIEGFGLVEITPV